MVLGTTTLETRNMQNNFNLQIWDTNILSSSIYIHRRNQQPKSLNNLTSLGKLEINNLISHHFKFSDAPYLFKSMFNKKFKYSKIVLSL